MGQALFFDGNHYQLVDEGEKLVPRKASPYEVSVFNAFASDVVDLQEISLEKSFEELSNATEKAEALDLALTVMNTQDDVEVRKEALQILEEYYLHDPQLEEFVHNRLYAKPLDKEVFNPTQATELAKLLHLLRLEQFYNSLSKADDAINLINQYINKILPEFNRSKLPTHRFKAQLADYGLFGKLVPALQSGNKQTFENAVFSLSLLLESENIPLLQPLRFLTRLEQELKNYLTEELKPEIVQTQQKSIAEPKDEIISLIENHNWKKQENKRKKEKRKFNPEILEKVKNLLGWIIKHIEDNDEPEVWDSTKQLAKLQLEYSDPEHLCKSICNIASTALRYRNYTLLDDVMAITSALNYKDAFVYNLNAEAFRARGEFGRALKIYKEAIEIFPDNEVAYNGMSNILKEKGDFNEAFNLLNLTIKKFPNDPVARNSKAELLKALGRYDESLKIFDETIKLFPNDRVSISGKAEVLKAKGLFEEAIATYYKILHKYPNDTIALNGLGDTFKIKGDFENAIRIYNNVLKTTPLSISDQLSKTEINDFTDGNNQFRELLDSLIHSYRARSSKADTLKLAGNVKDAIKEYQQIISIQPNNYVAQTGLLSCKLIDNKLTEAEVMSYENKVVDEQAWKNYHISAMYYLRKGIYSEAIKRLERGLNEDPFYEDKKYFKGALAVAEFLHNRTKTNIDALLEGLTTNDETIELLQADYYGSIMPEKSKNIIHSLESSKKTLIKKGIYLVSNYYHLSANSKNIPQNEFEEKMREVYTGSLVSY